MDELNEIDWDNLFPEGEFEFFSDVPPSLEDDATTGIAKENTIESWVEELLMKDDEEHDINQAQLELSNDILWYDILLDTPQPSDEPASLPNSNSSSCSNSEDNVAKINSNCSGGDVPNFESNGEKSENDKSGDDVLDLDDDTDHDDPLSKKRKRQLRNRDAAMRSRERKKMYVKDLEIKSRYMEAECRRLGRLLQCCYAENQMLRISLGSAYGASMAIPESAVLLLGMNFLILPCPVFIYICSDPVPAVRSLLLIPAVGFPGLVNGQHMPAAPTAPAKIRTQFHTKAWREKNGKAQH
uniref:BZIP domain-containing protein n=1 Tax=Chenopodium quinoa TaxID=63459 RepID=A0A803N6K3_CHEQI